MMEFVSDMIGNMGKEEKAGYYFFFFSHNVFETFNRKVSKDFFFRFIYPFPNEKKFRIFQTERAENNLNLVEMTQTCKKTP